MSDSARNEAEVPQSVRRWVSAFWYCMRDGRLGGVLAVALWLVPTATKIEALFTFPSELKRVAGFLLPIVTVSVWGLTLAHLRCRRQRDGKSGGVGVCRRRHGKSVGLGVRRRRVGVAAGTFLLSIVVFGVYLAAANVWVVTQTSATGAAASGGSPSRQFVLPLVESAEFKEALRIHGGLEDVKDNDAEWLEAQLNEQSGEVVAAKAVLIFLILSSAALLVHAATLITVLPKVAMTKDIPEAVAGELPSI